MDYRCIDCTNADNATRDNDLRWADAYVDDFLTDANQWYLQHGEDKSLGRVAGLYDQAMIYEYGGSNAPTSWVCGVVLDSVCAVSRTCSASEDSSGIGAMV